jgi:hypothetical protein
VSRAQVADVFGELGIQGAGQDVIDSVSTTITAQPADVAGTEHLLP